MGEPDAITSRATRAVFFALGWIFFGLGVAGAFLPVLPTTPLMILALASFSRSSSRFERWLYHHPRFGPRLQDWRRDRVIPLSVKLTAWGSMIASLGIMIFFTSAPPLAIASAAALMLWGAVFIARCPSRPPRP